MNWIKSVIPIVGILLLIIVFVMKCNNNKSGDTESSEQGSGLEVKREYYETYVLSSTPETHVVPKGYNYELSGGGKKYYHESSKNSEEIWGDGKYHQVDQNGTEWFKLRAHESEKNVIVVATFTPKN